MISLIGKTKQIVKKRFIYSVYNISTKSNVDDYVPRRAVLYVPGDDERKLKKIPTIPADCIVMDCEDGVALSKKAVARSTIHRILHNDELSFDGKDCSVRFNSVQSGSCEEDMTHILSSQYLPNTLHLPKVEHFDQLHWFSDKLTNILKTRELKSQIRLIIFTESAQSLLNLPTLCQQGIELSNKGPFKLDGIVFGSDDFCADIGATRTNDAAELLYARQSIVTIAKAFNLQAIDLVYIDYKNLNGLKTQSEEGATFGFTGKQVIHPSQVPVVQSAFTPSEAKVTWASQLIQAFENHQEKGIGAFTFRGSMIDLPLLLQAKNTMKLRHQIKK